MVQAAGVDGADGINGRPSKRTQIGDTENLVELSVEAAVQPHRSQWIAYFGTVGVSGFP